MGDDTLIYAELKNTLTDNASLDYFDQKLQPKGYLPMADRQAVLNKLDDILKLTNIKRACCLGSQDPDDPNSLIVKQQLPPPPGYEFDTGSTRGQIYKKYNFVEKDVKIPKSLCKDLGESYKDRSGVGCQNFYTVYCKNAMELFKNLNNGEFNHDEWNYYRPECACFAPTPNYIQQAGVNVAPVCFLPGCEPVSGVYMDPLSANPDTSCDLTICTANIDMSQFEAGKDIGIQNKIEQNCGSTSGAAEGPTFLANLGAAGLTTKVSNVATNFSQKLEESVIGKTVDKVIPGSSQYMMFGSGILSCIIVVSLVIFLLIGFLGTRKNKSRR